MNTSFLVLAVCISAFPFLSLFSGFALNAALVILILVFNYAFSVLFSVWIGLINVGVRKEIKSKSFAMTLAIRSVIGSYIGNLCFELMRWGLKSQAVTQILGGKLNSGVFFWLFGLVNIGMYAYFRKIKLEKQEKTYRLVF